MCPTGARASRPRGPRVTTFDVGAPRGRLHIEARLRYRKLDQFLLNFVRSVGFFPEFQGRTLTSPITDLHEARAVVDVQ
jgi:hypothetical protein